LSNEEKTNDYENFEKGMIYMKILKKGGGGVEKRGRRKRNPCPMRLWVRHVAPHEHIILILSQTIFFRIP
jgi:hypothetical protein